MGVVALAVAGPALKFYNQSQSKNRAAAKQLEGDLASLKADTLRDYEADHFVDAKAQAVRTAAVFDKAAANTTGEDAIVAKSMSKLVKELGQAVEPYSTGIEALFNKGGIEATTLPTREAVDSRIADIEALLKANADATSAIRSIREGVEANLRKQGVSSGTAKMAATGFYKGTEVALKARKNQHDLCEAMRDTLGVLRDQWGKWSLNEKTGKIRFESPKASKQFMGLYARMQTLSEEEQAIMREVAGPR